ADLLENRHRLAGYERRIVARSARRDDPDDAVAITIDVVAAFAGHPPLRAVLVVGRAPAAPVGALLGRVVGSTAGIEEAVVFSLTPHAVHAVAGERLLDLVGREFPFLGSGHAGSERGDRGDQQERPAHDRVP